MQAYPMVGFFEAIKLGFIKYFDCSSRSRRSEYWFFQLFVFLIYIILEILHLCIYGEVSYSNIKEIDVINIISLVFGVFFLVPQITITIRRLHDTGKSGCYYLFALIPVIGWILLIIFCLYDSEPKDNIYGDSPKYYFGNYLFAYNGDKKDNSILSNQFNPSNNKKKNSVNSVEMEQLAEE